MNNKYELEFDLDTNETEVTDLESEFTLDPDLDMCEYRGELIDISCYSSLAPTVIKLGSIKEQYRSLHLEISSEIEEEEGLVKLLDLSKQFKKTKSILFSNLDCKEQYCHEYDPNDGLLTVSIYPGLVLTFGTDMEEEQEYVDLEIELSPKRSTDGAAIETVIQLTDPKEVLCLLNDEMIEEIRQHEAINIFLGK